MTNIREASLIRCVKNFCSMSINLNIYSQKEQKTAIYSNCFTLINQAITKRYAIILLAILSLL